MAINAETPVKTFGAADGVVVDFDHSPTFTLSSADHLKVLVDGVESVAWTKTATGITFSSPPAAGQVVILQRITPTDQPTDISGLKTFGLTKIEEGLDRTARQLQEQEEQISRAHVLPVTATAADKISRTAGYDAAGEPVARTAAEELEHLGVTAIFDQSNAAAASAEASATEASASESVAAAAEALLESVVGNVFASRTFIFALTDPPASDPASVFGFVYVGNTVYTFDSGDSNVGNVVRHVSDDGNPYLFSSTSEAAEALAQIINGDFSVYEVEIAPSRTLLTGAHTEVTATAEGSNLIVSSKLQGTAGNGFTVNTAPGAVTAGAWVGDTLLGGQDGQLPVLTYDSIPEIPDRLFGIVGGELYFQLP